MTITVKTESLSGWSSKELHPPFSAGNLLELLRENGSVLQAPCGGHGVCGKCKVLLQNSQGVSYVLACETPVTDGATVVIEQERQMKVSNSGSCCTWPADAAFEGLGASIDVGTTTLVVRIVDLSSGEILASVGKSNPQISFGADVISRISACTKGSLDVLHSLIVEALQEMIVEALKSIGKSTGDLCRMVLAGNTTMQHIAAHLDPTSIGVMPFTPQSLFGTEEQLAEGLPPVHFVRCLAGYVGGDVTAGLLAIRIHEHTKPVILLDLGTNGEMALGDASGVIACATAAGPVFEGANIAFGMPAYPGAISKVAWENGKLELSVIDDEEPLGICGTGLIDAISLLLEHEVIDETGYLLDEDEAPEEFAPFIGEEMGQTVFYLTEKIYITQKDVRCLQLAKSAICSGILTMLDARGTSLAEVEKLYIAGGFGEFLNLEHAANVGIFPKELLPCAESVGNTSIEGATALLCNSQAQADLLRIVEASEYVELSLSTEFNNYYVEHMLFGE